MQNSVRISSVTKTLLIAAVLPLVSRCAFLNTFYNARTAFGTARRLHQKQTREYPDSLIEPTGDALAKYDRTIAKCQKVLEVYRRSKRWHDEAVFYMGKAYYYKCEMGSAIRQFRRLQEEFPTSEYVPQSYLFLSRAYLFEERYQKAEEVFDRIVEKYPELNRNGEISMLRATLALRREGKMQAIELLANARKSATSVERTIELTLRMAGLYMELKQYQKAAEILDKCPRKRRESGLMYRVDAALLECYIELDSLKRAEAFAEQMMHRRGYQFYRPRIRLRRAEVLMAQGRTQEAIEVYEKITKSYEEGVEAGEAWFRLAEIYHRTLGDYEKAKECYAKALTVAKDSSIVEQARAFSTALNELDTLRAHFENPVDSADSAVTPAYHNLTVGELFWLELEQADSAYERYELILDDSAAGDTLRAKALFAAGYISLHARGDTLAADSLFGVLENEYPANEYSKQGQVERNRTVTIMTREDSAREAFSEAEALYVENGNAVQAIKQFLTVYNDYPESEVAPKSLYAAAWLSDNVTFSKDVAHFLYEKLCKTYRESEYCNAAARPRLLMASDSAAIARERDLSHDQQQQQQ
jgi:tetratricopeptide (TPR) repeat protein